MLIHPRWSCLGFGVTSRRVACICRGDGPSWKAVTAGPATSEEWDVMKKSFEKTQSGG